jgi:hypothetical protein
MSAINAPCLRRCCARRRGDRRTSGRPNQLFRYRSRQVRWHQSGGKRPEGNGIRPIFVAALAAAMLPACTQSCDTLSSGQQFPIATDLFAHPMSIYWRDRLFSKMHYTSSASALRSTHLDLARCPLRQHQRHHAVFHAPKLAVPRFGSRRL